MGQTPKNNRISLSGLWLTVVLLVILILATLALLGSFISGFVQGDPNVIEVMADSSAMEKEYADDFPGGALPDMEASWETETSVDLFKNAYTGPDGSITVESANGDKLIAPGTSNTYSFTLKNTGNIALDYTLVLDGVFKLANRDIPMFVRLSEDGRWIIGGSEEWIHVDEMNELMESSTLPRGESTAYLFEWMWPYEMDEDTEILVGDVLDTFLASNQNDTELGNVSIGVDTEFLLNIDITSEISAGAIAEFDDGDPVLPRYILVCTLLGLMLGSGLWLLLLLLLRRNIYFTGLVTPPVPGTVTMDKKDVEIAAGRFTFPKTKLGKHTLTINGMEMTIRFKHSSKVQGLAIVGDTVTMGRKIRAVELYFMGAAINPVQWAAIDKKKNVYTPVGMVPPINDKNRTPGGLTVDEDGKYGAEELLHV